ncbi:MAG TPA: hypothetical protein VF351_10445 [Actinomycetota bacterium]
MPLTARTRSLAISIIAVLAIAIVGAAIAAANDDPDTPVTTGPIPGDPPPAAGPTVVEPRPGMADVYARPFDTAKVGNDDMTVTIDFVSGVEPCTVLDRVDVRYGTDAVTITLYEGHDPNAGDVACIEIGVYKRVIVQLDEPLAGRPIVDGAA